MEEVYTHFNVREEDPVDRKRLSIQERHDGHFVRFCKGLRGSKMFCNKERGKLGDRGVRKVGRV